jgi:DNA-binding response OmpR family regulator
MSYTESPIILVVDDEPELVELYTDWLSNEYTVRTAYGGEEALEELDESVDVVVLDRQMPTISGTDVLEYIRQEGIRCQVVIATGCEPDLDILEWDIEMYLTKPISMEQLHDAVENLLARKELDPMTQEYYQLLSKRVALDSGVDTGIIMDSRYEALQNEIGQIEQELKPDIDSEKFKSEICRLES